MRGPGRGRVSARASTARVLGGARLVVWWLSVAGAASAAYTQPELDRIARLYSEAPPDAARRARVELARADHSPDETAAALSDAVRRVPLDAARRAVLHELLRGPGSDAARSDLAPPVAAAVLARATEVLASRRVGAPIGAAAVAELAAAYDLLRADLGPVDPAFRTDARQRVVALLRAHLTLHAPTLGGEAAHVDELAFVRARAWRAVAEVSSGVLGRGQLAELLGLRGPARAALERAGYLLVVDGALPATRIAEVTRALEASPSFGGVSLVVVGKRAPVGLAGDDTLEVRAPVTAAPVPVVTTPFAAIVEGSRADVLVSEAAWEGARVAAARWLAARPAVAERARKLAARQAQIGAAARLTVEPLDEASDGDRPAVERAPMSAEVLLASAARVAGLDTSRALDAALARALAGRPEPLEQLRLGLTLLVSPVSGAPRAAFVGGKTRSTGAVDAAQVSDVAIADDGLVGALTLDGRRLELARTPPTRDGKELRPSMLATARIQKLEGDSFVGPDGRTFARLSGRPRVSLLDDGRVRVVATRAGLDAIGVDAPADVSVVATLLLDAQGAAVVARAAASDDPSAPAFTGVALLIRAGEPSMAALVLVRPDGKGEALSVEAPLPEQPERGYPITLSVKGASVTASVGDVSLSATLDGAPRAGRVAIAARGPGYVEARDLVVGKPLPAAGRVGTKKRP